MYDFLRGRLVENRPGRIVLDVGGIGFVIKTPDHTHQSFQGKREHVSLWTHLIFKEDNVSIYGFAQREERDLFILLLKVSGVGPRVALQILSGIRPAELAEAMENEDWKRLTLISGIGPKTAKRLLIELKEALTDHELIFAPSAGAPQDPLFAQAYNALTNLGFSPDAIRLALKDTPPEGGLENIVKSALAKLTT